MMFGKITLKKNGVCFKNWDTAAKQRLLDWLCCNRNRDYSWHLDLWERHRVGNSGWKHTLDVKKSWLTASWLVFIELVLTVLRLAPALMINCDSFCPRSETGRNLSGTWADDWSHLVSLEDLLVRELHLIPHHFHTFFCVHSQGGTLDAWDIPLAELKEIKNNNWNSHYAKSLMLKLSTEHKTCNKRSLFVSCAIIISRALYHFFKFSFNESFSFLLYSQRW